MSAEKKKKKKIQACICRPFSSNGFFLQLHGFVQDDEESVEREVIKDDHIYSSYLGVKAKSKVITFWSPVLSFDLSLESEAATTAVCPRSNCTLTTISIYNQQTDK